MYIYFEECLTEPKGQNYEGTKSVTKSGIKCQAWSVKTPHSHSFSKRLSNQVNYCRNPDGEPKPWCYTTDKTKRWEFCDIPECGKCFHKISNTKKRVVFRLQ